MTSSLVAAAMKAGHTGQAGGGGGNPFSDRAYVRGPITKIDVRHAAEVDWIKFYYADSPAEGHGGGGGNFSTWTVSPGYEIVRIDGRSDQRIDRLQFVARNAEGKHESSPVWGGGGGTPFSVAAPDESLPLRFVEGRSQHRLDQLIFHFGYPYRVTNLQISDAEIGNQLLAMKPVAIDSIDDIPNPHDYDLEGGKYSNTKTESQSHSFSWGASLGFTYGQTTQVGISGTKVSASTEVSWSLHTEVTVGQTTEKSESVDRTWDIPYVLPKHSYTTIKAMARKGHLSNIPFTYDVEFYDPETNKVMQTVQQTGTYNGLLVSSIHMQIDSRPMPQAKWAA